MNHSFAKLRTLGLILLTLVIVVISTENHTVLSQSQISHDDYRLVVKFKEGSGVRLRAGRLTSLAGVNMSAVQRVLQSIGVTQLERLFQRPEAQLENDRQSILAAPIAANAPQTLQRKQIADLNLFYAITVTNTLSPAAVDQFLAALKALPEVEDAYYAPQPVKPPAPKLQSTTPLFVSQQFYLNAPPLGVDAATYAWGQAGGKGAGVTILDLEYAWNFDHEDLPIDLPGSLIGGEQYLGFGTDHGTAVLGIMGGIENSYGITGLAPQATIKTVGMQFGGIYNLANAINIAAANSSAGDIILIEQQSRPPAQLPACPAGCFCGDDADRYMPVEDSEAEYAAITNAVALGRVVVIAAGNGYNDLDWDGFDNKYNRAIRDSGAIYVGAGYSGVSGFTPVRLPHCFSNHGSRVDVQGIGDNVFTTGGGDAFGQTTNTLYTRAFNGTSSSAPIVAGSAAILQGIAKQRGFVFTAWQLRDLLKNTGQAQASSPLLIGPRPDLRAAVAAFPTDIPTPTSTATSTATIAPSATANVTPTYTPTLTSTATATNTATSTATIAPSATASVTPTYTPTLTSTATATNTATYTATDTPSATASATPTYTPTSTSTATATNTATYTATDTPSATASATPTYTPTSTSTATATNTATSTATDTPSATASATATYTPTPTSTPTATNTATYTATDTPSATASTTPTSTATATITPSATASQTPMSTSTPTYTPTPTSTVTTDETATATPSSTATGTLTAPKTIGIFRSSNATFYLRNSNTTGIADSMLTFGRSTDFPIVGDWNGDGIDTPGVYRPTTGEFFLTNSTLNPALISSDFVFGIPGDQPIVGDWDGDGKDTVGLFRPSNGLIYLKNSLSTGFADFSMAFGIPGDIGLAGDWDGDGKDSLGVYRPSTQVFYVLNSVCTCAMIAQTQMSFGNAGDIPFVGDWDGNGESSVGVYRPSNGVMYLKNGLTTGIADLTFTYGSANDYPLAGNWVQRVSQSNKEPAPTFQP